MITIDFDSDTKTIHATANGKITKEDIETQARPKIEEIFNSNSSVQGSLVNASQLEGWENLDAMTTHFSFLKEYDNKLPKIALISNSMVQETLSKFSSTLVDSEVKHFSDETEAKKWLQN
jgi:hypothetical protein